MCVSLLLQAFGPSFLTFVAASAPGRQAQVTPALSDRSPAASGQAALVAPGNVLLLIADDMGVDQLAAYGLGKDLPPTPNLDRMAAQGVLFRNAWSQPLCSPTRATVQTGRYGFRTTIGTNVEPGLPLAEVTLPEMLALGTGGLTTSALIGKWHLGTLQVGGDLAPNAAGYGHFAGSLDGQIGSYFRWRKVVNGVASIATRYNTSACVDDALSWIGQQTGRWVCVVAFPAPHAPFEPPPPRLHTQVLPQITPHMSCEGVDPSEIRPFYKATIQALDTEIGRLLAGLPDRDRTTVLFMADNGTSPCAMSPQFQRWGKGSLHEGGINVPLIASGYRVAGPGVCSSLVNTSDVFATVAELAGVDLAATLPGHVLDSVSFAPCLAQPTLSLRPWTYAGFFTPNGNSPPQPVQNCPGTRVCQPWIGFDGPGNVLLESCGEPLYGLYGAHVVPWRVTGGPPFANGWLRIGTYSPKFKATVGSWFVSGRGSYIQPFTLDSTGSFSSWLWTGNTSTERQYQAIVRDPAQPLGFSVSGAVGMNLLPSDMEAIREARYKLIRLDPCREELYDLAADPLETTDLLQSPLSTAARAAYDKLSVGLDAIR